MRASRFSTNWNTRVEVVDRGQLVAVREPRDRCRGSCRPVGLRVLLVDGRHEPLLRSGEDRRVPRVVRLDAIGPQPPERIEVVAHDPILPGISPSMLSSCSLPLGAVEFAESSPGPVEPRPHGADRDAERVGDLLVAEALPHVQHERVALRLGQRRHRLGDPLPQLGGVDGALTPSARSSGGSRCAASRATARMRRASPRRCLATRFVAMPYSHGRAVGRSRS